MTHPRAVIFDLDGTLADSLLDFDAIRAEIGLAPGLPILEQLADVDAAARDRAEIIMRRHERDGDRVRDAHRRLRRSARPPARRSRSRSGS